MSNAGWQHPDYRPRSINQYVPKLAGVANMDRDNMYMADFGTPKAADADGILDDAAVGATYTTANFLTANFNGTTGELDGTWGRTLTFVASGAGTNAVTVTGYDYLGQRMVKVYALNGTTPVPSANAFKWIESIVIASGGSITVDVGFGGLLGLPFYTQELGAEYLDGVKATNGTLTAGVTTDPATNATGDPRGLYTPNSTLNGTARLTGRFIASNRVNASGNGGLHGIAHYGG